MAVLSDYTSGTITVTQGSADFTGTDTLWRTMRFREGDMVLLQGYTMVIKGANEPGLPIASNTSGQFTEPWPGTSGTFEYRMRYMSDGARVSGQSAELIELLGDGNIVALGGLEGSIDNIPIFTGPGAMSVISKRELTQGVEYDVQVNTIADRATYDAQPAGFTVLVSDIGDGRAAVYSKASAATGDWTDPAFLTGPSGSFQSKGAWDGATPYNAGDVVTYAGSSWVAKNDNTNQLPPNLPDIENEHWVLLAQSGNSINIRGAYDVAASYLKDDVVYDAGSSWIALQATTGNAPPTLPTTSNTYWSLLSARGSDGTIVGPLVPQGRLTLTSGVAVTTTDVSGQTTIYYTPCAGNRIPIHNGTDYINTVFAELSLPLDATTSHTNYHEASQLFDCFVFIDGGTVRLGTGPKWATVGAGTSGRGTGAGTTELEFFNGFNVNKNAITLRFGAAAENTVSVPARRATYVGTFYTFGSGQAADTSTRRFLFNAYNQVFRTLEITEAAATWEYSTNSWRVTNNNGFNQVTVVAGLSGVGISLEANSLFVSSTTEYRVALAGIGVNSSTANSGKSNRSLATNLFTANTNSTYRGYIGLGYNNFRWLEKGAGIDTQTWRGTNSGANDYSPGLFGEVWI